MVNSTSKPTVGKKKQNSNSDDEINSDNYTQSIEKDAIPFRDPPKLPEEPSLPKRRNSNVKFNEKVLSSVAKTYDLQKFNKNYLLIFNHKNVSGFRPRTGTDDDVDKLRETFARFQFVSEVETDLKENDLIEKLKDLTTKDFTDYGCIVVAVLTYGVSEGFIYASDNKKYSELDIFNYLQARSNPTLLTKPKVLLIEACPGRKVNNKVTTGQPVEAEKDHDKNEVYTLPNESDLLLFHNSYSGKAGDETKNFQFIQSLCDMIDKLSPVMDLEEIFSEIQRKVAIDMYYQNDEVTSKENKDKQIPVVTSTLTRKLVFETADEKTKSVVDFAGQQEESSIRNQLTTGASSTPQPIIQNNPCCCFLYHFEYIREYLRLFVEQNPNNDDSNILLEIADTIDDDNSTYKVRYVTANHICNFLRDNGKDEVYFYIYKGTGNNEPVGYQTAELMIQYGPCFCFLEYFEYIRERFRVFVERNPQDEHAESILEIADAIGNLDWRLWDMIYISAKSICRHLRTHARNEVYYNLYFFKHK